MALSTVCAAVFAFAIAPASAATGDAVVKFYTEPIVRFTLTPNFNSGYGSIKAVFGTQPAPTQWPGACFQACAVDFGTVLAGSTYLYKYAAHLNVATNDQNGFNVYGEGAADFTNTADNSTSTLDQTLYYLPTAATCAGSDVNTGFTPGLPFRKTSGGVSNNSFTTEPTISYTSYPVPVTSSSSNNGDFCYDYQLKVPFTSTSGTWYVWVVYTVVPR